LILGTLPLVLRWRFSAADTPIRACRGCGSATWLMPSNWSGTRRGPI